MNPSKPQTVDRDSLLSQLKDLTCDAGSPDSFAAFVETRAKLLATLDTIMDPWTQSQKAMLQEALVTGAHILAEAHDHRQNLARKIDHLRGSKRSHKGYSASAPARIRKLF